MSPAHAWWAPALNPLGLSQGDLLAPVPIGTSRVPVGFIGRDSWPRQGKNYWPEYEEFQPGKNAPTGLFLAKGTLAHCLVISHSCELDDKPNVGRVIVAPVGSIERVPDSGFRERIMAGARRAFMPLPGTPKIGDAYADLRAITFVERALVPDANRVASMTEEGVYRLQAQVVGYFSRLEPEDVLKMLPAAANEDQGG